MFVNSRDLVVIFDLTNVTNINNHLLLPINRTPWGGGGDFWPLAYLLTWLAFSSLYLISVVWGGGTPTNIFKEVSM